MSNKSIEVGSKVIFNGFDHDDPHWVDTFSDMIGREYEVVKSEYPEQPEIIGFLDKELDDAIWYVPISSLTLISKSTDGGGKKEEEPETDFDLHVPLKFKSKEVITVKPVSYVPYQLCPKCNGQGTVIKPPHIAGDIDHWTSSEGQFTCDVCEGEKIIPMFNIPTVLGEDK